MEVLGYFASVCVGIILGLLGGGGSILCIPILVYLFHIDVVTASAYSLFIVGITSLVGAAQKYRENRVNLQTGMVFGLPSIAAIFITRKWVIPAIPDVIIQTEGYPLTKRILLLGIFAVLMIISATVMIRSKGAPEPDDDEFRTGMLVVEGILIGFLTGLVGAGGGFLIIPALVLLTGLPFKTAVGTSLFIIAINSLMGFMGDVLNYPMDWTFLLVISALAVAGIVLGNFLSRGINSSRLRMAFGWLTLLMGIFILLRELIFA